MTTGKTAGEMKSRRFAKRAAVYKPFFWDEVAAILDAHPDAIYFGGGAPNREMMPYERLQEASQIAWANARDALDYGELAGYAPLRELISARMAAMGMVVPADEIVITNGSQQGIDIISRLFLQPGDTVVVEGPTYLGALQAINPFEVNYLAIPVDDEGMRVEALKSAVAEIARPPKVIYTIPTFQNPTGYTMTRARREALLEFAREYDMLVLEDDPYGEIFFDETLPEPPLRALDPGVVYLGTFSKTIAPGLRVGWMAAPRDIVALSLMAREASDIHGDRILTRTVYHAAKDFLDEHLVAVRAFYRRRRDLMLGQLEEHMPPSVTWSVPRGGFFVWVTLPDCLAAEHMLELAADHGVVYLPGAWFYPNQEEHSSLRLSYSCLRDDELVEGVRRLGRAVSAFLRGQERTV
ncbi:MAG: PLP-dependent aminotransferase family protein [Thermomicrobiales bacterium]